MRTFVVVLAVAAAVFGGQQPPRDQTGPRSQYLETLAWPEAEQMLTPETVVLIPLGAASKEHGPHLRLRNDAYLAEHLTQRVVGATPVVVAPQFSYHFYPAFVEYPGSVSLSMNTAREFTADVVRSLARFGPRRFYVLNTGISTLRPLASAAQALRAEGILLTYTDLQATLEPAARSVRRQEIGSHADEIETSMMLHLDPSLVDMSRAVKDAWPASTPFTLTRRPGQPGTYSASGIWGDPTLATREKGKVLVDALVAGILDDIARLRTAPLPAPATAVDPSAAARDRNVQQPPVGPSGCSTGDERTIRNIGTAYAAAWATLDAERLALLWSEMGDMAHPDGTVERMSKNIFVNRLELFRRREYRSSKHFLQIGVIRCLSDEVAVADGKWELRDVTDAEGRVQPTIRGLATLVVKRANATWLIEAYRYTVDSPEGPRGPTLLKRPGYPGRGGGGALD